MMIITCRTFINTINAIIFLLYTPFFFTNANETAEQRKYTAVKENKNW